MPGVHTASAGAASDADDDDIDDDELLAQPDAARRMTPAKVAHHARFFTPEA